MSAPDPARHASGRRDDGTGPDPVPGVEPGLDPDAAAADGFVVLGRARSTTAPGTDDEDGRPGRRVPAQVVACTDGPLLVRGDVDIVGPDGEVLPRDRRTVALCRCGTSSIKPWCDGTHKAIGFRTGPEPAPR